MIVAVAPSTMLVKSMLVILPVAVSVCILPLVIANVTLPLWLPLATTVSEYSFNTIALLSIVVGTLASTLASL